MPVEISKCSALLRTDGNSLPSFEPWFPLFLERPGPFLPVLRRLDKKKEVLFVAQALSEAHLQAFINGVWTNSRDVAGMHRN